MSPWLQYTTKLSRKLNVSAYINQTQQKIGRCETAQTNTDSKKGRNATEHRAPDDLTAKLNGYYR